ncbi:MAG TPA: spore cortex-lytic enzyme [Limnochordia bacterium]|nr:spore cortex-lytic enzyme [Limnochordia bacterium]
MRKEQTASFRQLWTIFAIVVAIVLLGVAAAARPTLYWGSTGSDVKTLQWKLEQWGYYNGTIDGVYGASTYKAVRFFQWKNGIAVDGVVGPGTWSALGLGGGGGGATAPAGQTVAYTPPVSGGYDQTLLARIVAAEARGEPYAGQVAVAAVILNRVQSSQFPNTVSGVIFQPGAFESVSNGLFWSRTPDATEQNAARDALNGYDPTYGAIFFWNPSKPITSTWIWSRPIVVQIGHHVFAK